MDFSGIIDVAPELNELSADEYSVILEFTLLWSLFESKKLDRRASIPKIEEKVDALAIDSVPCESVLNYFKQRYFPNGEASYHFGSLNIDKAIVIQRVAAVLKGEESNPKELLIVCLIIVFRYRNNLFHGIKWVYGIKGQHQNFEKSNELLRACLRLFPDGI